MGSVGRATCLHHIEVVANSDDGVEFFGGTVDLKYGVVFANDDDGFDWDHGYTGRGQFWVVIKVPGLGDNGLEIDSDDSNSGANPKSHPTVYNVTCIGDDTDSGIEAKELTEGEIYNSIFANYSIGLNLYKTSDRTPDAYDNWIAGSLIIENSTFVSAAAQTLGVDGGAPAGSDNTKIHR